MIWSCSKDHSVILNNMCNSFKPIDLFNSNCVDINPYGEISFALVENPPVRTIKNKQKVGRINVNCFDVYNFIYLADSYKSDPDLLPETCKNNYQVK